MKIDFGSPEFHASSEREHLARLDRIVGADDEDDGEGRMDRTIVGVRPYVRSKDRFFDMQMKHWEAEKALEDRFAY